MGRVLKILVGSIRMYRRHHRLCDTKRRMHHHGNRRQTVGRAGSIGKNRFTVIPIVVHAHKKHRDITPLPGCREQHFFGARVEMLFRRFSLHEAPRTFQDHVHVHLPPGKFHRVRFRENRNISPINNNSALPRGNVPIKQSIRRVIFQEMRERFRVRQIIDRNHLNPIAFRQNPESRPPDPSKSVYCNSFHSVFHQRIFVCRSKFATCSVHLHKLPTQHSYYKFFIFHFAFPLPIPPLSPPSQISLSSSTPPPRHSAAPHPKPFEDRFHLQMKAFVKFDSKN